MVIQKGTFCSYIVFFCNFVSLKLLFQELTLCDTDAFDFHGDICFKIERVWKYKGLKH